jgi:pimeloyl-ACP methyl ester carboxylesterase
MAETRLIRIRASGAEGVSLGILEKRPARRELSLPPILLIHGATFGAVLFDLPLPGYSLMSHLANGGRVVYALDIRGYGHSVDRTMMDAPPECHPPVSHLSDAVEDIGAASPRF